MRSKGQGATELLVLLAVIALTGLIIYSASQTNISQSSETLITSQARATVNDLSSAASQVYSEGVGAKTKVYITIPEGANPSRIFINNTIINIGMTLGPQTTTDINTQTSMKVVQGADFPTTPGSYWVTVTAMQGYVLIGDTYLLVNPTSLSFQMSPATLANGTVTFTNNGNVPLSVNLTTQWSYPGIVDLAPTTANFALASGAQYAFNLTVQTYAGTPLTSYSGVINVTTNSSGAAPITVNVDVIGTQLPTGVFYITVDTFKDAAYSIRTTNFTLPYNGTITGSGWSSSAVTINIVGPSGTSVSGYPTTCATSFGSLINCQLNPAGLTPGVYNLTANQSLNNATYSFNVTACS
jgi:hypothetical protein